MKLKIINNLNQIQEIILNNKLEKFQQKKENQYLLSKNMYQYKLILDNNLTNNLIIILNHLKEILIENKQVQ